MSPADVDALIAPLDGDAPAGPNLEYDPDFQALERAAAPKAERAVGDSVIAAEEPDWEAVAELAGALLTRTKDLRVAMHLTTAWTRLHGLKGWAAGLGVIHGLLENFWPSVHPELDADDDNDPTFRVNSIAPLGNILGTLRYFRITPFVQSQRLGRFSLRDLRIANGSLKVPPSTSDEPAPAPPTMQILEGACMDCSESLLAENAAAVAIAFDHAKAIDRIFTDHIGSLGPDLKQLVSDIFELKKFIDPQLARRRPSAAAAGSVDDDDDDSDRGQIPAGRALAGSSGQIASTQDVVRRLEELCDYYAKTEPSSPVPILLRRAQRLVGKDFLELLKDLAPGGIGQLQVISGPANSSSGSATASAVPHDDDD